MPGLPAQAEAVSSAGSPTSASARTAATSTYIELNSSTAGRVTLVGARSEDEVRRVLAPLQADGWRLRHSLPWRGRGDIDSLAIAPGGLAFAVETKTRAYDDRHLARVREQAAWLARRRRRWCRRGAVPVICVVRARGVQRLEQDVLVVSLDQPVPALQSGVGGGRSARPRTWVRTFGGCRSLCSRLRGRSASSSSPCQTFRSEPAANGRQPGRYPACRRSAPWGRGASRSGDGARHHRP